MFIATYEHFYHRCKAPLQSDSHKMAVVSSNFEPVHSNRDLNWTNALGRIVRPRMSTHFGLKSERLLFNWIVSSKLANQFESITINLKIDFDRKGQPSCFEAFNRLTQIAVGSHLWYQWPKIATRNRFLCVFCAFFLVRKNQQKPHKVICLILTPPSWKRICEGEGRLSDSFVGWIGKEWHFGRLKWISKMHIRLYGWE